MLPCRSHTAQNANAIAVNRDGNNAQPLPDFDGDGTVGFADFVKFAAKFGLSRDDEGYDRQYDLDGDGTIGFSDFLIFASSFGSEGPSPVFSIPDANLRAAIETALKKASGAPITEADLKALTLLEATFRDIRDLTGLEAATNLAELDLWANNIEDITPLAELTNLTFLNIGENNITDKSVLANLTNLTILNLWDSEITDISMLAGLTNLRELVLLSNEITDVSPLAGLTNLTWLDLRFNNVKEVGGLAGLTNLTWLGLRGNPLNLSSINDHVPVLVARGATVQYDSFQDKGDYDVELVFLDSFSERDRRLLRWAARRWMAVIREDLPDYEFAQGWSGTCGDHSIEIPPGERIDDLRIYVISIEDGPLGWGGPDVLRDNTHLPLVGCMAFDVARSNIPIIGLHEIGHVLGFGTIWDDLGFFQNPPNGDQHFNGPLAIDAFDDAGGREYTGAKVPVTGGHWRTSVFGQELMTYGGDLSAITIQSLADLGYSVDVTQADPYTLLNPRASAKIVPAQVSNYLPDEDIARTGAHFLVSQEARERGWSTGAMRTILGYDRLRVTLESPEAIWYPVADFGDYGLTGRLHSPPGAEPETTCGAGISRDPIYVVDSKGRIIRTIDR